MSLPGAPAVQPGDRLDRYELLCPVAQGGMAVVWVGRLSGKHGVEKLFAIKMIRGDLAQDRSFEQMFLNEARIAARIQHPNVASIVELGEWHDVLYMVMEWVDGDSVSKLARIAETAGKPFPVGVACRIVADALGGLHAAHELRGDDGLHMGVVHRDVSPQNILVTTAGNTKLIDFGIAKARDRLGNETTTGTVKGKFSYMSPEQASGRPLDRTTDIFAAGAVLYHVLAGHPPFVGDNPLALLSALVSDAPPAPLPAHVPREVAQVIYRALERQRVARYPTAEEMQRDLEMAMARSGAFTTAADVAVFVAGLTSDRVAARKNAIDLAVSSLSARRQLNEVLSTAFPSVGRGEITDARTSVRPMELGVATKTEMMTIGTLVTPPPGGARARRVSPRLGVALLSALVAIITLSLSLGVRLPLIHRPNQEAPIFLAPTTVPPAAAIGTTPTSRDTPPQDPAVVEGAVAASASAAPTATPAARPLAKGTAGTSPFKAPPQAVGRSSAAPPPRPPATKMPSAKPERNGELGF
jgi:serine/threonine-protein kinase